MIDAFVSFTRRGQHEPSMNPAAEILFGRGSLPVSLPGRWKATVIEKPRMPVLPDPGQAAADAFAEPCGGRPLAELAARARSVCIVVDEDVPAALNGSILPPLIAELAAGGIALPRVVVLVANGLRDSLAGERLRAFAGSDRVMEVVRVESHDASDDGAHVDVGVTTSGVDVRLDRRFVEADLKIVLGLVESHIMGGYSGGRMLVVPGVAHASTIRGFYRARVVETTAAHATGLDGNLLHGALLEVLAMIGAAHAVNVCRDPGRGPAFINFGEMVASHRRASVFMRRHVEVTQARAYRCVITSAGGHPLDRTYQDAVRGMVAALGILTKGGTLLLAAECAEGLGSEAFGHAQARLIDRGIGGFLREARHRTLANVDEWQTVKLVEALRDHRVHLYAPGLDESQRCLTAVSCHDDWTEAVTAVLAEADGQELAVLPAGPSVVPRLAAGHR